MNKYHEAHKHDPEYKAKNAARASAYYAANREKALTRVKARAKGLVAEKSEYDRQYYVKNKAKRAAYYQGWYTADPSKALNNVRQWRIEHPTEHNLHNGARRAKTNGVVVKKEDIKNWHTRICGVCSFFIEAEFHIDHIIPLSRGGEHSAENLQLTHPACNLRKHNKLQGELPPNVLMLT